MREGKRMSELLEEAKQEYKRWKTIKPPEAPPKEIYTYEEACLTMWHDACVNVYENMIYLIKKHEYPKGLMNYVHPPYWGFPLEFSTNFWALKYRVLSYVEWGKSVIEAREAIEREFSKFHFAEIDIELTEEQQEIYTGLKGFYEFYKNDNEGKQKERAVSLALAEEFHMGHAPINSETIPALKKFISEVEE